MNLCPAAALAAAYMANQPLKTKHQQVNLMSRLQVKKQWSEVNEDAHHLQETPLIKNLNITAEEMIWAANVVTSRTFAGLKKLGMYSRSCLTCVCSFGIVGSAQCVVASHSFLAICCWLPKTVGNDLLCMPSCQGTHIFHYLDDITSVAVLMQALHFCVAITMVTCIASVEIYVSIQGCVCLLSPAQGMLSALCRAKVSFLEKARTLPSQIWFRLV